MKVLKTIRVNYYQITTFNESFTPKSKLFNKTVYKKHGGALWRMVIQGFMSVLL